MSPSSRSTVSLVLAFLLASAGCVGVLAGSEPLTVEASPVSVSGAALSDTGYEEQRTTTQQLEEEVSAAGQTRQVVVTNHVAEYARTIDAGQLGSGEFARFVVVSTPAVEVLGQTFNPVGSMTAEELVAQVQDSYGGLEDVRPAGERTATVLGSSATVDQFEGKAELGGSGQAADVTIDVVRIRNGPDFIVVLAVYPTVLPEESDHGDTLLGGIQHDG